MSGPSDPPPSVPPPSHAPTWLAMLGPAVAWLAAVAVGFVVLGRHETTPGTTSAAPATWPTATRLARASAERATVLLFAHPKCPCTRATMGEFEILMARSKGHAEGLVVFVRPPGVAADWERTDLWDRAAKIPDVAVSTDESGVEAKRFGAITSGQLLLYDSDGVLRFSGGITGSRGHSGDNAGRSAVEDWLAGRGTVPTAPVFGCALLALPCAGRDGKCEP